MINILYTIYTLYNQYHTDTQMLLECTQVCVHYREYACNVRTFPYYQWGSYVEPSVHWWLWLEPEQANYLVVQELHQTEGQTKTPEAEKYIYHESTAI